MSETSIVRKIYKWKPSTSRPVRRHKCRREDVVRSELRKTKNTKWAEQYRTALNGRILLREPRLYQSCSAEAEEEQEQEQ